jgi:hypothetical protein
MASVTVSQGVTVTTDFALVPIIAELAYAPDAFEQTIVINDIGQATLTLTNTGTVDVDFSLADIETGSPEMAIVNRTPQVTCLPDVFGYTCTDSTEPDGLVTYDFEDISGTGTPITLGDDQVSPAVPLGFTFNFYDVDYTDVYVSSNGFVTFLAGSSSGCCSGQLLPNPAAPNGLIAGWWDDLNPTAGGTIQYQMMGQEPSRYLIVQFTDVPHYSSGNPVTFQYKLFEGSNNVEVHYQAAPNDGSSHSAGIENESGTDGLSYYYGAAPLADELAVCYLYPGQNSCGSGGSDALWLVEMPITGTLAAGESIDVQLLFDATAVTQTGTYTAEIYFAGTFENDLMPATAVMHVLDAMQANPSIDLDVTLSTDGSCGISDTLTVAPGTMVYYCYTVTNTGNVMLPTHNITDTVWGHIDTFTYNLFPGASESVIHAQTVNAEVTSTATWAASNADMGMSAEADATTTILMETYYFYLPIIVNAP